MTALSGSQALSRISHWHPLSRFLLTAALFIVGGCKYKSDALRTQLGTPEGSTTYFMTFDASDVPVVSNGHGHVFRLEADQWVQLPTDGLVGNGLPLPIMCTHDGA